MNQIDVHSGLSKFTKPERIGLIVSTSEDGTPNVMTAGWVMRTSGQPPLLAVSVAFKRYTHGLINRQKEFVVAFPSAGMGEIVKLCGSSSGREVNKIERYLIKTVPAAQISCPLIEDAVANFECKLHSQLDTGDHTIFVGQVVAIHCQEGKKVLFNWGNRIFKGLEMNI